jgi:hypothetical protein
LENTRKAPDPVPFPAESKTGPGLPSFPFAGKPAYEYKLSILAHPRCNLTENLLMSEKWLRKHEP